MIMDLKEAIAQGVEKTQTVDPGATNVVPITSSRKYIDKNGITISGANGNLISAFMVANKKRGATRDYVIISENLKALTHDGEFQLTLRNDVDKDWIDAQKYPIIIHRSQMWRFVGMELMGKFFWKLNHAVTKEAAQRNSKNGNSSADKT